MKIIITTLLLCLTAFCIAQNNGPIRIIDSNSVEPHKNNNSVNRQYPTITEDNPTTTFKVCSYDQNTRFVIIKNSNPEFIKIISVDKEGQNSLKLNNSYGLYRDSVPYTKNKSFLLSREFELKFDVNAKRKYGTLSIYTMDGKNPIFLSYKHESITEAFKIDTTKINRYDNTLFMIKDLDTVSKTVSFSFDSLQIDKTVQKTFILVNPSKDTISLNYIKGNEFANYNWGSIQPIIDTTKILPLSKQDFVLQLHPKKDSIPDEPNIDKTQRAINNLSPEETHSLDTTIGITVGNNFNQKIVVKAVFFEPKSKPTFFSNISTFYKSNVGYLNPIFLLLLILLDYYFFQFIFRRPSIKTVKKHLAIENKLPQGNEETKLPKIFGEWKSFLEEQREVISLSKSKDSFLDSDGKSSDKIQLNRNKKAVQDLCNALNIPCSENDFQIPLTNVLKKFENLKQEKKQMQPFKEGFREIEVTESFMIKNHVNFIKELSSLQISSSADINTVRFEREKAKVIDEIYQILRKKEGSPGVLKATNDLSTFKKELSEIVSKFHAKYPAFVYEFTEGLKATLIDLKKLTNTINVPESIFAKKVETLIFGRTGKRGFALAHEICMDTKEDGLLAQRLGLTKGVMFRELKKQDFYQKFISSFKLEINTLCILYAYSKATTVAYKMQKEGIDLQILKTIYERVIDSLKNVGVSISMPSLFRDTFKEGEYEMAQDSSLIYHFGPEIEQLDSGIIYDLTKVAIITNFDGNDHYENLPKVLYKT
ncbi:hypothetical protein POV27_03475 [Aureisphaera galaxeae]|uniref:hypothetical protein n=1 Tax=Aureisphaera galaxeae TaxID=1538023 RepID=UPI00234FBE7B|nr:hypothetical protein [Aureisphaera galaxeae]MDC8003094.1 hypothetical protein [Aureisphaera galaxeae]